jgi:hypothetical protein
MAAAVPAGPCRTYSTLVSGARGKSRLQQLVDWLGGPSFDGCIVLDECEPCSYLVLPFHLRAPSCPAPAVQGLGGVQRTMRANGPGLAPLLPATLLPAEPAYRMRWPWSHALILCRGACWHQPVLGRSLQPSCKTISSGRWNLRVALFPAGQASGSPAHRARLAWLNDQASQDPHLLERPTQATRPRTSA